MTMIRTLAFAGLTMIASAGAAFAAPHASQAQADQYQSYYQGQQASVFGLGGEQMSRAAGSCYKGVYPWTIETCGIE